MVRSTTLSRSKTRRTERPSPLTARPDAAFVGLDYHKKFTQVSVGNSFGQELLNMRLQNDPQAFREFFAGMPKVRCAIESCRGYEWLLDLMSNELNLEVDLVNAHKLKIIVQSRCKTDKIDARSIMQMLAIGFLPTCYKPSLEERRCREQLRWRAHLVRYATRFKVRIHAILDKRNLSSVIPDPFSSSGRQLIQQLDLDDHEQNLLQEHMDLLEHFEKLVKAEDKWVLAKFRQTPDAQLLETIPGIGELTAVLLWCELGNISRFQNAAQVAAYFGLVPRVDSSAAKYRFGPITKEGSKFVRWMLIQCAWQAIRYNLPLRQHFESVSKRAGKNGAIISVARKLVKICYRVLRDQKRFDAALVGNPTEVA
jgi:transposase